MFETFFIGRCRWSWDRFLLSGFCGRSRCFCLLSCCRCGGFGTGFWCLLFVCCCSFCKLEIISNHYFFVIDDNKQCPDCEARHKMGLGPWLKAHCSEFWLAPFTLHGSYFWRWLLLLWVPSVFVDPAHCASQFSHHPPTHPSYNTTAASHYNSGLWFIIPRKCKITLDTGSTLPAYIYIYI